MEVKFFKQHLPFLAVWACIGHFVSPCKSLLDNWFANGFIASYGFLMYLFWVGKTVNFGIDHGGVSCIELIAYYGD